MTYWVYAVNKRDGGSAVVAADIRVTYKNDSGEVTGFSEDLSVQKIICVCKQDGSPFNWGSAIVLVAGSPFWDTTDPSSKKNIIAAIDAEFSKSEYEHVELNATALVDYFCSKKLITASCLLGIIFSNTKEISSAKVEIGKNFFINFSVFGTSKYGNQNSGAYFEYDESVKFSSNFFANSQRLYPLVFKPDTVSFDEQARMVLEGVVKQYSLSHSGINQVGTSGFFHNNTVASSVDLATIQQSGEINLVSAPRSNQGFFFPNAYNLEPVPNNVFYGPPVTALTEFERFSQQRTQEINQQFLHAQQQAGRGSQYQQVGTTNYQVSFPTPMYQMPQNRQQGFVASLGNFEQFNDQRNNQVNQQYLGQSGFYHRK